MTARRLHRQLIGALGAASALLVMVAPSVSAQAAGWQPGPGAVEDNTYTGFIDAPSSGATVPGSGSFTVAGWFVDQTAEGWAGADDVQVWLGSMDGGGRMLAKALVAQNRPDVGNALGNPFWSASGFAAGVPGLPGGSQGLNVYVHTPGKGWWFMPLTVNGGGSGATAAAPAPSAAAPAAGSAALKILNPTENQNVSTKSDYTINGQVSDPNSTIDIWIFGERNTQYATELGTATPNADGTWSLTFVPTHFPSTHSNLYVYAKGKSTGVETLVSVGFNIVDR